MKNKNLYKLLGMMALEFRLSLDNLCKLLGKEVTEQNKMDIYKAISLIFDNDPDYIEKFKYLFFYETFNEPQTSAKIAYFTAVNYLKRYNKLSESSTSQEKKKILDELHKTDSDFRNIKNNLGKVSLTDGEVAIISKYRIKNVIPREIFCKNYGIHYSTLHSKEFLLSSNILKEKLTILGEYCEPYIRKNRNSRKAK